MYFTVCLWIPNSFGRLVSTFSSLIVNTTVNDSFVIPGSFASRELSVKEKSQLTVDTFVPGSLSKSRTEVKQFSVGGW